MTALHYQYAPMIIALAKQATIDGTPINRPLWWIDPLDPVALTIDSGKLCENRVIDTFDKALFFIRISSW